MSESVAKQKETKVKRMYVCLCGFEFIPKTISTKGLGERFYYLGMDPAFASLLFVISAIIGFGDSWLIGLISRKTSKRMAWSVSMGSWAFSTLILVLFVLQPNAPTWMLLLFIVFNGLGINTQYQVAHSMIPDSIEVEEFTTGERREGAYYGLTSFIQKVGASITMAVSGFVLAWIGYDGVAEVQSQATLNGLKWMFGFGCGIFLLLSIIFVWFNPMTEKRHLALTKAIQDQKEGKAVDTSEFEALL